MTTSYAKWSFFIWRMTNCHIFIFYHNPLIFNYKFIFALLRAQILQYYEAKQKGNKNINI